MIDYIKKIIVPYVTEKRKELKLSSNHSALVLSKDNVLKKFSSC